jgi:hypothetical protein
MILALISLLRIADAESESSSVYLRDQLAICLERAMLLPNGDFLPHVRLAKDLMDPRRYDSRIRPVLNHTIPTKITFSMSLYQILAIVRPLINSKMLIISLERKVPNSRLKHLGYTEMER